VCVCVLLKIKGQGVTRFSVNTQQLTIHMEHDRVSWSSFCFNLHLVCSRLMILNTSVFAARVGHSFLFGANWNRNRELAFIIEYIQLLLSCVID